MIMVQLQTLLKQYNMRYNCLASAAGHGTDPKDQFAPWRTPVTLIRAAMS